MPVFILVNNIDSLKIVIQISKTTPQANSYHSRF